MTEHGGQRRAWVTVAVSTTLLLLLLRQRRQKRKAAQQSAADATRATLQSAMQRSLLPVFVQADALPVRWGVAPPVFYPPHSAVIPLVLPSEMAEIERSGHVVRKVGLEATGGEDGMEGPSAFILCSHTGVLATPPLNAAVAESDAAEVEAQQRQLLAQLLAHHPVLKEQYAALSTQWTAFSTALAASEKNKEHNRAAATAAAATPFAAAAAGDAAAITPAFTHLLQCPDGCLLLGGVNGPYFTVAVLTGFEGSLDAAADADAAAESSSQPARAHSSSGRSAATASADAVMDLASVVRGVAQATFRVPLPAADKSGALSLASARLPGGAAFAVHQGFYRVLCVRDGRGLELCVPAELLVHSELVNQSLITPAVSPLTKGPGAVTAGRVSAKPQAEGATETLLTLTSSPSRFTGAEGVEVSVTAEVFAGLAEKPEEAAAALWQASGASAEANPAAAAAFRAVTARALTTTSHGRGANMVTLVYVQPKLGVLFSVHPLSSVVYEPWMTDLPTILYYPLGEDVEADREGYAAPPLMSIQYILELPSTWEVVKKDEEELRHNVLFHFTNWEAATVSSSMTEISGLRCVMFHEVRDGRRCRSYILPRGSTVLVVRWETSVEMWETYLPLLQQTLDTLHVDATAITQ
ncbi:hypothetical protein N2W54_008034 [Lotmaria passim]